MDRGLRIKNGHISNIKIDRHTKVFILQTSAVIMDHLYIIFLNNNRSVQ